MAFARLGPLLPPHVPLSKHPSLPSSFVPAPFSTDAFTLPDLSYQELYDPYYHLNRLYYPQYTIYKQKTFPPSSHTHKVDIDPLRELYDVVIALDTEYTLEELYSEPPKGVTPERIPAYPNNLNNRILS